MRRCDEPPLRSHFLQLSVREETCPGWLEVLYAQIRYFSHGIGRATASCRAGRDRFGADHSRRVVLGRVLHDLSGSLVPVLGAIAAAWHLRGLGGPTSSCCANLMNFGALLHDFLALRILVTVAMGRSTGLHSKLLRRAEERGVLQETVAGKALGSNLMLRSRRRLLQLARVAYARARILAD